MERIALRTKFSTGVNWDEVRKVLSSALRNETELVNARRTYFGRACHAFEQQYQMSSEEFMRQFESGVLGDDADYFDWYAAKRGLDLWERRFLIVGSPGLNDWRVIQDHWLIRTGKERSHE